MIEINLTCSLGGLCHSSQILKKNNLKLCSYPFDWIFSNCDNIIHCIEDDFNIFLDKSYYINVSPSQCGHSKYHEVMFNHHNPLINIDHYNYYIRCVDRFKNLLQKQEHKLFIMIHVNMNNIDENIKNKMIEFNKTKTFKDELKQINNNFDKWLKKWSGETDEDWEETQKYVKELEYFFLNVCVLVGFPFLYRAIKLAANHNRLQERDGIPFHHRLRIWQNNKTLEENYFEIFQIVVDPIHDILDYQYNQFRNPPPHPRYLRYNIPTIHRNELPQGQPVLILPRSIKQRLLHSLINESSEEDRRCSVCMRDFSISENIYDPDYTGLSVIRCGHSFCEQCIQILLSQNFNSCPLCRADMT